MSHLTQLLIALDQLGNALLAGWADETISSRAWRQRHKLRFAIAYLVIDGLAYPLQRDHCRKSYESEALRLQIAAELRADFRRPAEH